MIKNPKVKKMMVCFVLGGFLSSIGMQTALAANTMSSVDQIVNQARQIAGYEKLKEVRNGNSRWKDKELRFTVHPKTNTFKLNNTKVTLVGTPQIDYDGGETVYIGRSILTNSSSQEQTLTTQSFSESVQDVVTTTTTHAVGTSVNASANFQVPFVGKTGLSLTSSYNFSRATTNTNARTVTHTVEAQKIAVPANTTVEVSVVLKKAKITGNVALKGQLVGSESGSVEFQARNNYYGWMFAFYNGYTYNLADLANKYGGNKGSMEQGTYFLGIVPNSDGSINIEGKGTYTASVGAELYVTVKDVKTGRSMSTEMEGIATRSRNNSNASDVKYPTQHVYGFPKYWYR